jgi:hypothetical protein
MCTRWVTVFGSTFEAVCKKSDTHLAGEAEADLEPPRRLTPGEAPLQLEQHAVSGLRARGQEVVELVACAELRSSRGSTQSCATLGVTVR